MCGTGGSRDIEEERILDETAQNAEDGGMCCHDNSDTVTTEAAMERTNGLDMTGGSQRG